MNPHQSQLGNGDCSQSSFPVHLGFKGKEVIPPARFLRAETKGVGLCDLEHISNRINSLGQVKRSSTSSSTPESSTRKRDSAATPVTGVTDLTLSAVKPELTPENGSLYKYIEQEKRSALVRKAALIFLYGGLKRSAKNLPDIDNERKMKEVEYAARLILNNLLLNAWRKEKFQLTKILHENAQLTISVENLGLQLRVLRHLQGQEKDQANAKQTEIRTLKAQLNTTQKSLRNVESELEGVEEEIRYGREDNEKLKEQKDFLTKELEELMNEKAELSKTLEAERLDAGRIAEEYRTTKNEYSDLRKQMKALSAQTFQWKDRTRTLESQRIQTEDELQIREGSLCELDSTFKLLLAEREELKANKEALEESLKNSEAMKVTELENWKKLKDRLEVTSKTVRSQREKVTELEESVKILRLGNAQVAKELYWYRLGNVRNRRAWANAMKILSSPTLLLKYLIFGSGNQC